MSFLTSFEDFFKKILGKAPEAEQYAQSFVAYAGPAALGILAVADPALLPIAQPIIQDVTTSLGTISAVTSQAMPAPGSSAAQTLVTAIGSVNNNLASLLQLWQVKNSTSAAQITAIVGLITDEANTLLAKVAPAPATTTAP